MVRSGARHLRYAEHPGKTHSCPRAPHPLKRSRASPVELSSRSTSPSFHNVMHAPEGLGGAERGKGIRGAPRRGAQLPGAAHPGLPVAIIELVLPRTVAGGGRGGLPVATLSIRGTRRPRAPAGLAGHHMRARNGRLEGAPVVRRAPTAHMPWAWPAS